MTTLRIGFMPLTDAAGLIAAADFGFAEAQGIAIELHKEVSWANLRDKLMVGSFDAAHFLGAATIACALGIGQRRYPLRAAMLLNRNGNAITLASRVADELLAIDPNALDTWQAAAKALAQAAAARRASGRHQLTFGTVFPFSSHTYLLRRFFAAGGLDPDQDVEIIVTPPPFHHVVAARIGCRREQVTRELSAMVAEGLVEKNRGGLVLLKPQTLEARIAQAMREED